MLTSIQDLRNRLLAGAKDEHGRELALRAYAYALGRVKDGSATTEQGAKLAMAAFADGFCTGFHRGNGTSCTR